MSSSSFIFLDGCRCSSTALYSLVVSLVGPRRPAASQRGQVLPTSFVSAPSVPLCSYLSSSQHFSVSLSSSVHLCSFTPRLAARSGLCISVVPLFLSVLSGSLLHLFLLQSSPLRAPRDCFSGSYGALSHTLAFIKSLILKGKFEYLY